MGRKRKAPIVEEEKENEDGTSLQLTQISCSTGNGTILHHGPMYTIMSNVQLNETFHKKYIKEMQQLYSKMDHDAFMFTFIKMIKSAMEGDENNDFANTTLLFCAKFVGSYNGEDTHPVLVDISKWLLTTISNNPHIRFRLCQFVNMVLSALGTEAALDDAICDSIMEYMLARLRDISPSVRVQAILALQRLQVPDNPDDPVLRSYQFHLCSDPSPRVRQAVITSMGRNYNTIPYILDRLWDIDEKVRRHTYLHMSSYPVKSYKVSQRLMLMEQGLHDRSEIVRKVVVNIMLQQWIESYQKNLILLVSGLKLDSVEGELDRFRKIAKLTLKEIFKRLPNQELVECIPFEEDGEFHRCVPHGKLTIEISLYWQCLAEYLQEESADELDIILPELSVFCAYVERYCQSKNEEMDKFEKMEFQYILLSLMEILYTFDLGDEIGRDNLKKLLPTMLKSYQLEEKIVAVIIKCAENLIDNQNARLQYFVDILQDMCGLNAKQYDLVHDRNLINELMEKSIDAALNLKLSSLKVKILDLEEQEMNYLQNKDYANAHKIREDKNACSDEYSSLLSPLLQQHSTSNPTSMPIQQRKITNETILQCLQVAFYMVVSEKVQSLTLNVCKLYRDFICRYIASNQIAIRDWALRCGIAYSMLYESLAKDVFEELYSQFYKNHNIRIWKTAISGIFELLDRYGMDNLVVQEQNHKVKKPGRQLYNTLEFLDAEEEEGGSSSMGQGVDVIYMMSHFLDTCDDICIMSAIVNGLCRLILRGHVKNEEILEKLLLRYFNPTTDNEINQILGVFLENLIQRKKQELLYPCLLPTVRTVLSAPYDSPLQEIKPETITRFVIDATRPEFCMTDSHIHNKLAEIFLQEMQSSIVNKELFKLLSKEIITLELNMTENETSKKEMEDAVDKLLKCDFDPKTIKNLIDFKDILDGKLNRVAVNADPQGSDEEEKSDYQNAETVENDKNTETTSAPLSELLETAEKEALTHVQNESELPSQLEANKVVSPSAATPTTYGRENRVGLRHLRKSLNNSRNNSISDSGDGPSRPPKIRIEARIDSDKKLTHPTKGQYKAGPRSSRARRNLRRNGFEEDFDTEQGVVDGDSPIRPNDVAPPTMETTNTVAKECTHNEKQNNKYDAAKELQGTELNPVRRTKRNPRTKETIVVNKRKPSVSAEAAPVERWNGDTESDNADIIPASPTSFDSGQNATRLRRKPVVKTPQNVRSMRSRVSAVPTSSANLRKALSNNARDDGEANVGCAALPRNSRKRTLRVSSSPSNSDTSTMSPRRKQARTDDGTSKAASRTEIAAQRQRAKQKSGSAYGEGDFNTIAIANTPSDLGAGGSSRSVIAQSDGAKAHPKVLAQPGPCTRNSTRKDGEKTFRRSRNSFKMGLLSKTICTATTVSSLSPKPSIESRAPVKVPILVQRKSASSIIATETAPILRSRQRKITSSTSANPTIEGPLSVSTSGNKSMRSARLIHRALTSNDLYASKVSGRRRK